MKYLIDAQLPKRLCIDLKDMGYNAKHTLDLPNQNKTKDYEVNLISINEKRVVISKDSDFVDSILISKKPYKLLHITTGNISNHNLLKILMNNFDKIDKVFEKYRYVELSTDTFIIHQ